MWDWLPVLPQKDYEEWLCRRTVNKQATLLLKTKKGVFLGDVRTVFSFSFSGGHLGVRSIGRSGRLRAADYDKKLNRLKMIFFWYCVFCQGRWLYFCPKIIWQNNHSKTLAVSQYYHLRVVVLFVLFCCKLHIAFSYEAGVCLELWHKIGFF